MYVCDRTYEVADLWNRRGFKLLLDALAGVDRLEGGFVGLPIVVVVVTAAAECVKCDDGH